MAESFYPAVLSLSVLCYLLAGQERLSPRLRRFAQFLAIAILGIGLITAVIDTVAYLSRD